ncbi:TetR/AcrR family transcriptional regulator [Streptomyces sp. SAS_267]|uniref:TetR/AcrR family transcriptional regulator n=1 Tax=unclassified Streptomyces TaxID=2593676 RepID=UPI0036F4C915
MGSQQRVRRSQEERSRTTTNELLSAARKLFARDGYTATSLDAICEEIGASKGALYHHFKNKRDLFRAVYEAEENRLSSAIAQTFTLHEDPWDGLYEGMREFLVMSMEPSTQRITLIDAPGALGWAEMRAIRSDCRRMIAYGLGQLLGRDRPRADVTAVASMVHGAACESAVALAHADGEADELLEATLRQFRRLFTSIASSVTEA